MKKLILSLIIYVIACLSQAHYVDAFASQDEVAIGEEKITNLPVLTKTLAVGESGTEVAALQEILIKTGYLTLSTGPTGYYGPKTVAAVKLFQSEYGIQTTGIVGPQTLVTINNPSTTTPATTTTTGSGETNTSTVNSTGTTSYGTYTFTEKLGLGSKGPEVVKLQKFLADRKLFDGAPTGYFGFQTKEALFKYQRMNKIGEFGSIGTKTLSVLNTGKVNEAPDISEQGVFSSSGVTTTANPGTIQTQGTGSITLTITPASAISKGARWQISGKTDVYESGKTAVGLTPGNYTITFKPIMSHIKPKDISVTVTGDTVTTATGVYVPAYDILEQVAFVKQGTNDIRYKICLNPLIYPTPTFNTTDKTIQVALPWKNSSSFSIPFSQLFTQSVTILPSQLCGTSMPFTFQYSFNYILSTFPPFGMNAATFPSSYVIPSYIPGYVLPLTSDFTIDPAFTGSPGM